MEPPGDVLHLPFETLDLDATRRKRARRRHDAPAALLGETGARRPDLGRGKASRAQRRRQADTGPQRVGLEPQADRRALVIRDHLRAPSLLLDARPPVIRSG
jgi:hypothetical protein